MIDPVSLAVGGAAIAFVNSVGPRIVQALIPTKFDQAQVVSIANQRERLVSEERRFEEQIRESRERLLAEHGQRLELAQFSQQLSRWPMEFLPADYIRRSGNSSGRSLNIIVRQSDHRRSLSNDPSRDKSTRALREALFIAEDQMLRFYAADRIGPAGGAPYNGVLFYPDFRVHPAKDTQSIVTVLSGLISTEPTVLFDIAIRDNISYRVTVSHWGEAYNDNEQAISLPPFSIDLSHLVNDEAKARVALSITLSSAFASMADTFHLLRRPHEIPIPAMYELMAHSEFLEDARAYWKPITETYRAGLGHIGSRSPLIASELAANASLAAHKVNQKVYADLLLADAVGYFCRAVSFKGDDRAVLARLGGGRLSERQPFKLQTALETVGGLPPSPKRDPNAQSGRAMHDIILALGPSQTSKS